MPINLNQYANLFAHVLEAQSRVQKLQSLRKILDSVDISIDSLKIDEVQTGLGFWSIQKREIDVAESLDELSDKMTEVACVIEAAEAKAKKEADWYYRELQRQVFFNKARKS